MGGDFDFAKEFKSRDLPHRRWPRRSGSRATALCAPEQLARYFGPEVPKEELIWQDPIPAVDHALIDSKDINDLKTASCINQ